MAAQPFCGCACCFSGGEHSLETILFLLLLYWIFGKNKKKKAEKKGIDPKRASVQKRIECAMQMMNEKNRPETKAAPAPQPAQIMPGEGESHMAFTQDAHGCVSEQEEYMGSMLVDSSEGEDACDPSLEHERMQHAADPVIQLEEIGREPVLDLSSRGIWQGVVMNEILTRPSERMRRMQRG